MLNSIIVIALVTVGVMSAVYGGANVIWVFVCGSHLSRRQRKHHALVILACASIFCASMGIGERVLCDIDRNMIREVK